MNQPMRYTGRGVCIRQTDHLAVCCKDVDANRKFAEEVLGLRLREQVVFENGETEIGSWMSSTTKHHELAYVLDVKGLHGRLHHFCLLVDDKLDVLQTADILSENDIYIKAGPSKHNNSQAFYLYSIEPGCNRIEVYTSGFFVYAPDFGIIVWDEDTRGTGVYWGGTLPESFLNYAPPNLEKDSEFDLDHLPVFSPH